MKETMQGPKRPAYIMMIEIMPEIGSVLISIGGRDGFICVSERMPIKKQV
jgi:hypothetical protein